MLSHLSLTTSVFTRDFSRLFCLVLHALPFLSRVNNIIIFLKERKEKKKGFIGGDKIFGKDREIPAPKDMCMSC